MSRKFLERQRRQISDRAYRTEYEAEFVDAAGTLIRNELIETAIASPVDIGTEGQVAAGVDWAQARDHTTLAIVRRWGRQIVLLAAERIPRGDYESMVESIARRIEDAGAVAVAADCTGLGSQPTTMLSRRLKIPVQPFNFNRTSKGLLIEGLVRAFELGEMRMNRHEALIDELRAFRATPSGSGSWTYAAAGSGHDDLVIALALALHALPYAGGFRSRSGADSFAF